MSRGLWFYAIGASAATAAAAVALYLYPAFGVRVRVCACALHVRWIYDFAVDCFTLFGSVFPSDRSADFHSAVFVFRIIT